jgi:hypothetical protein
MGELGVWFMVLLATTAFLYSSVGHGGASGYLALMALYGIPNNEARTFALIMNILVSGISFYNFYKRDNFQWKLLICLLAGSVPAAFLGGGIDIDPMIYKFSLGILLLFPVWKLLSVPQRLSYSIIGYSSGWAVFIGLLIGGISGVIGIGGGIILSPVLLLLHWSDSKQTASLSALFIFINSIAGLLGNKSNFVLIINFEFTQFLILVFLFAILGSYIGAEKYPKATLSRVLGLVLLLAAVKLLNAGSVLFS